MYKLFCISRNAACISSSNRGISKQICLSGSLIDKEPIEKAHVVDSIAHAFTGQTQHLQFQIPPVSTKVQGRVLLDVVVTKSPNFFELLAKKDRDWKVPSLSWKSTSHCRWLSICCTIVLAATMRRCCSSTQGVRCGWCCYIALHKPPETANGQQVQRGLLLNVVLAQCTSIFELLCTENQALPVRRETFLVLDFLLDVLDCVGCFHFQCKYLASGSLHQDLHCEGVLV